MLRSVISASLTLLHDNHTGFWNSISQSVQVDLILGLEEMTIGDLSCYAASTPNFQNKKPSSTKGVPCRSPVFIKIFEVK
jgi:predicted RNase H-like nuclease